MAEIKTEEDRNDSYRSAGAFTGSGDLGRGPGDSAFINNRILLSISVGRGVYRIDYWSAGAFAGYDDVRRDK